jgi:hypothetical protein
MAGGDTMKFLRFRSDLEALRYGEWDALTGAFPTLTAAEQWLDSAPPELTEDPALEAVTVLKHDEGSFVVVSLAARREEVAA